MLSVHVRRFLIGRKVLGRGMGGRACESSVTLSGFLEPFIPLCNIGEVSTSFMVPSVNEEQDSVSRDAGQTELFFYICLKFCIFLFLCFLFLYFMLIEDLCSLSFSSKKIDPIP